MELTVESRKRTARIAGLLYLLVAIVGTLGLLIGPSKIIVWGDSAATAQNLIAHEFTFRFGIITSFTTQVLMLLTVWVLYRLFKDVNQNLSLLMFAFIILGLPISFLRNILKITAMVMVKGHILQSFNPDQIYDLAEIFLRIGSYSAQLVQLYWGLWLIPFGILVYKSGFIPRLFGVLLNVNGFAYVLLCITFVLFPMYKTTISQIAKPFIFIGEIPVIFWLLIKGVKNHTESHLNVKPT